MVGFEHAYHFSKPAVPLGNDCVVRYLIFKAKIIIIVLLLIITESQRQRTELNLKF